MSDAIVEIWTEELSQALVAELEEETVAMVSGPAAAIASVATGVGIGSIALTGTGAGTGSVVAGLSTAAKVGLAALAVTVGAGVAGVTGTLPDPFQTWLSDLVDEVGLRWPASDQSPARVDDTLLDSIMDPSHPDATLNDVAPPASFGAEPSLPEPPLDHDLPLPDLDQPLPDLEKPHLTRQTCPSPSLRMLPALTSCPDQRVTDRSPVRLRH